MRGHTWQDWHDQQGRNADSEAAEVRRSHAKTLADLEAMLECQRILTESETCKPAKAE